MTLNDRRPNPLEVIIVSETEILINKGHVFNMNDPEEAITISGAEEDAWRDSGEPFSVSVDANKVFVKVKIEEAPTVAGEPNELINSTEGTVEYPPGSGTYVTRTTRQYFKIGDIISAEVLVDSDFPESSDQHIIIEVAEILFEPIRVQQIAMSDIWLLNPLLWEVRDDEDSDESDSDSTPEDDSDSDDSDSDDSDTIPDDDSDESDS